MNIQDLAAQLDRGASLADLTTAGATLHDIIAAVRCDAEAKHVAAQRLLDPPPSQPDLAWAARKAWLLDGQAIHGELSQFYCAAFRALQADDQATYSKQRDLLFKALKTFLGVPHPEIAAVAPAEPEVCK